MIGMEEREIGLQFFGKSQEGHHPQLEPVLAPKYILSKFLSFRRNCANFAKSLVLSKSLNQ